MDGLAPQAPMALLSGVICGAMGWGWVPSCRAPLWGCSGFGPATVAERVAERARLYHVVLLGGAEHPLTKNRRQCRVEGI